MKKRYYIAYGSNLNVVQMSERCPDATIVGKSEIKDGMLSFKGDDFDGYYLTIEPMAGYVVPVGIWETSESDEESLDKYENYPITYYKTDLELDVKLKDSDEVKKLIGYIYIMQEDKKFGNPTDKYVETCMQGYRDFGFDEVILKTAIVENKEKIDK